METRLTGRLIAIGDIHGYSEVLDHLLKLVNPGPSDTIVSLGDYIDRGPDSRGVIERLIDLQQRVRLVPILGNHDEMLLDILDGNWAAFEDWLSYGGTATLASYNCATPEEIPKEHIEFLRSAVDFYEAERHFFVHAGYDEDRPLSAQDSVALRWRSLRERLPGPHISGKIAVVGHTAQRNFEIFAVDYLICIDTCCYGGGWLTALEVNSGECWQVSPYEETRHFWLQPRNQGD